MTRKSRDPRYDAAWTSPRDAPNNGPMKDLIARRDALRHLGVLAASFALPGVLQSGCSRRPSCADVTGLSPDEVRARNDTAAYTETAPDPSKKCSLCAQWVPPPSTPACGGCKVVKGPINPEGGCRLFVAKADGEPRQTAPSPVVDSGTMSSVQRR